MKPIHTTIAAITPLLLLIGCGSLDAPDNEKVKGGEIVVNFPATLMKQTLLEQGLIEANSTVFGYKAYKIPYETTDEEGNLVEASGLFVIPTGISPLMQQVGLSMVSDDHGTIFANDEAPTVIAYNQGTPDGSSVILTSLGGFATLQPDYIGFGDSQGEYHPFILKKSLASSTIDFIHAVKHFSQENNITLNDQLYLTGYSEGGYAALSTLQKIEEDNQLHVTMTAPMAGPYDLNLTAFGVLSTPTLSVPSFMAEISYAYAKSYHQELTSILNEPYASKLPTLVDGTHDRMEIDQELTTQTTGEEGLFSPTFVNEFFHNPNNWFRAAMVENSVHAWSPQTPVRLLHCQGDDVIPYGISQVTAGTMNALGAKDVALIPVEPTLGLDYNVTHRACGVLAYKIATQMFATTRQALLTSQFAH